MDKDKEDALEEARQALTDGFDLLDGDESVLPDPDNQLLDPDNNEFGEVDVMGALIDENEPDYEPYDLPAPPPQTFVDVHQKCNDNLKRLNRDQKAAFDVAKASIDKFYACKKQGINYKNKVQFISGPGGVGKSFVLDIIRDYAYVAHMRQSTPAMTSTTDTVVITGAPTGLCINRLKDSMGPLKWSIPTLYLYRT